MGASTVETSKPGKQEFPGFLPDVGIDTTGPYGWKSFEDRYCIGTTYVPSPDTYHSPVNDFFVEGTACEVGDCADRCRAYLDTASPDDTVRT